jgi:nucleoside-diphosphate-sugar epimerase
MKPRAAVTGGTGFVGARIVARLVERGFDVKVLTRRLPAATATPAAPVRGDLGDRKSLDTLVGGVEYVFHCAAEIADEARMDATNVDGTRNIVGAANAAGVKVFCHLSSVGVIGPARARVIDEQAPCAPRNRYEKTKLEAERIVAADCAARTVILRPTNVVAADRPGVLAFLALRSLRDRLKLFLKGREVAHAVHVDDVAAAAVHLALGGGSGCYIVSTDDEPGGTYGEIRSAAGGRGFPHCPVPLADLARRLLHGPSVAVESRYTSRRLLGTGYRFETGLPGAVERVARPLVESA